MAIVAERSRVAIIGAGHVGSTTAYALMLRAIFREIVLIDANAPLAQAEAADLLDGNALARPAAIWSGTYSDADCAQIAVITAGAATHGTQSRLSIAKESSAIVTQCVRDLMEAGFSGVILVAANPVDLMSLVALRASGLPAARVIGTGTLLDTSRLHRELASRLGVSAASIDGYVLGEHGDSEFVAFSTLRIGSLTLENFTNHASSVDLDKVATRVRTAAYGIIAGKGSTTFGIATAIVRICEAIVRDEHAVLPVSTLLSGQFGGREIYLSLPCILGSNGIERALEPRLNDEEVNAMQASIAAVSSAAAALTPTPSA